MITPGHHGSTPDGQPPIPPDTPLDGYTVDDGLPLLPPTRPVSMTVATACLALAAATLAVGITVVLATGGLPEAGAGHRTVIGYFVVPVAALLGSAWVSWSLWRGNRGAILVAIGGSSAGLISTVTIGIDLARYLTAAEPHFSLRLLGQFAPFDVVLAIAGVFAAPVFLICVRPANTRWADRHSAHRHAARRRRRGLPYTVKPPEYWRD